MRFVSLALLISLLSACTATREGSPYDFDKSKQVSANTLGPDFSQKRAEDLLRTGHPAEAAALFAVIGEMLLYVEGFNASDDMFTRALSADAKESRALFYTSLIRPLLAFQGYMPRLKDGVSESTRRDFNAITQGFDPDYPALAKFALELPKDKPLIKSHAESQNFLKTEVLPPLLKGIEQLTALKNQPLNLALSSKRICENDSKTGWICQPQLAKPYAIKLDESDYSVLIHSMEALSDGIQIAIAYSLEGIEEVAQEIQSEIKSQGRISSRDIVSLLRDHANLFKLNADNTLPAIYRTIDLVIIRGIELNDARNQLCENSARLAGISLFRSVCLSLRTVLDAEQLTGFIRQSQARLTLGKDDRGNNVEIKFNLSVLFKDPPADLKNLLPKDDQFDANGEPSAVEDGTMGGLFPDNDFFEKVSRTHPRESRFMSQNYYRQISQSTLQGYTNAVKIGSDRRR